MTTEPEIPDEVSTPPPPTARPGGIPLRCDHVSVQFRKRGGAGLRALEEFTLDVHAGELVCVIGPSGCGKTTILNVIAGLLRPTTGAIFLDGRKLQPGTIQPNVAYMTQKDTLLPWLTAVRNVHFAFEAGGRRDPRMTRSRELLHRVGLTEFEDLYPHELSGGMRKRAQFARSLAQDPDVLLMDEPFGALDYLTKARLQEEFLRMWEADRKTVVFITHDLGEAIVLADRIVVMSPRPATIRAIFDVNIDRPRVVEELIEHPEYVRLHREMWKLLH